MWTSGRTNPLGGATGSNVGACATSGGGGIANGSINSQGPFSVISWDWLERNLLVRLLKSNTQ